VADHHSAGAAASLRDSLLTALLRFGAGPAPVRTALCVSLAGLTAHLPAAEWGAGGAVTALADRLAAAPPGHGGSGDALPQQQAAPAAAEYHDHDEDGDAVYWSASGNSNGGQWGNQQQRR